MYLQHSYHNFVLSNIRVNLYTRSLFMIKQSFFRIFNFKDKYIYINDYNLKMNVYLYKITEFFLQIC